MEGKFPYFSISSISFSKSSGLATGGKRLIVLPSFEMRNVIFPKNADRCALSTNNFMKLYAPPPNQSSR